MTAEDQPPGRVAYQGAPGAFSHEACLDLRPWDEAVGFETFQGAIDAVLSGDCHCALIPVENATGNFTKITQRVPVRIAVEHDDKGQPIVLRPGLSVEVKVDLKSRGGAAFAEAANTSPAP